MNKKKETTPKEVITKEKKVVKKEDKKKMPEKPSKETLLENKVKELETQINDQKEIVTTASDKILRAYAELENFKKRKEQEFIQYKKFAEEKMIVELLPILDHFNMACDHLKKVIDKSKLDETMKGFTLIQKQFHDFFVKVGVEVIESLDQPFDPNKHEAVMTEEANGKEPNTVIKEMQRGYSLKNKVIRPAMVVVSK